MLLRGLESLGWRKAKGDPEVLRAPLRFVVVHLKIVVVSIVVSDALFV